jgi:hypothetical protein
VLLALLVGVWSQAGSTTRDAPGIGSPVLDQAEVDAFLANRPDPPAPGSVRIPTGVFVQSVEFLDTTNVQVTGYIWQTYPDTVPPDIQRGFVLPEAVTEAYQAEEVYRHATDGGETIGWYGHATLRQPFTYGRYPFDRHDVWLRLRHPDLGRDVLLVPDFAAYAEMTPTALPGLEEHFVYEGWDPEFTGFSYVLNRYTTTFGVGTNPAPGPTPELYYSIGLKRDVLSPLLDQVLPLGVIALLLFMTLTLATQDHARQERLGNHPFDVLWFCTALLFVVILSHNGIRGAVSPQQIAYLEIFPFTLYVAILLVALNTMLLALPSVPRLVAYRDNLLPRLLYGPLLCGCLLLLTLIILPR